MPRSPRSRCLQSNVLFVFAFGTSAEWIKLRPVADRLSSAGNDCLILRFHQQYSATEEGLSCFRSLDLRQDPRHLGLQVRRDVLKWAPTVLRRAVFAMKRESEKRRVVLLVHGDTMTATLAAIAGLISGVSVVHVEAGLRSGSLRSPFPEELSRRIVGLLADLHFCPNQDSFNVIQQGVRRSRRAVMTNGNTSLDAIFDTFEALNKSSLLSVGEEFLCVIHRAELLLNRESFLAVCSGLAELSRRFKVTWVCDEFTLAAFRSYEILPLKQKEDSGHSELRHDGRLGEVILEEKLPHSVFLQKLATSRAVITDSGGLQEECAVLRIPCIILRERTERPDGLGETAQLVGHDVSKLLKATTSIARAVPRNFEKPHESPADLIVESLMQWVRS